MASASAAERSATTPELRHLRAQQVILVFSNQVCVHAWCPYILLPSREKGREGKRSLIHRRPHSATKEPATIANRRGDPPGQ